MKSLLIASFIVVMTSLSLNAQIAEHAPSMAIAAQGGGSFPMMGGGSYGGGVRFEYGLSRYISLLFPVEYRFVALGGFSESPIFKVGTVGWGGRCYFSQWFWEQGALTGFYVEVHTGIGYAAETRGDERGMPGAKNHGATFSLSGMLGYAHTFKNGLVIGGGINYSGRGFVPPMLQKGVVVHPNPELLGSLGWAF